MPMNCRNGVSSSVNIWQVSKRPVAAIGEYLLDDGMIAVLRLGLDHLERRVRKHGMVPPDREQLVLPAGSLGVEVFDPADDQPGGDCPALPRRERRVRH